MILEHSPEDLAFREEVRAFVRDKVPADSRARMRRGLRLSRSDYMDWQSILFQRGWGSAWWPVEFGGTGWTAVQQLIFDEECCSGFAPPQLSFGLKMVAPVIMAFGNPAQQDYFLPRILTGEHWWCQGYSEPDAGSDLASLKTAAVRDGDNYVVNGQKTWTTLAQYADWIFCLVRTQTGGRKQEGISFLLIDMKSPGVTVRPIIMLDGEHEINEVWFDNVRVPLANRVGDENKGWTYAKYLLGHERSNIAGIGRAKRALSRLKAVARREMSEGHPLIEDPRFRDRVAQAELELTALEVTNLRVLAAEGRKKGPGPESSILKLRGSELQQNLAELIMMALGHYALPYLPEALDLGWQPDAVLDNYYPEDAAAVTGHYFNMRKTTIYGGASEIQRNIIAQMILGL